MDEHFELLHNRLKLTANQRAEVKSRVNGVSRSLYKEFYEGDYNPKTRLIIGSHGKKTESREPVGDIDLIFKITKEDLERYKSYESNGPSALLARAKNQLEKTYPVSEKRSWGKVVLVEFNTGHDVEVLPCFEKIDGTFTIPNSENGGSWDHFNPRAEMKLIKDSNDTTEVTRKFIRMIKRWNNKSGKKIKSYQIEFFSVTYLDTEYSEDLKLSQLIEGFFTWLEFQKADLSEDASSRVATAKGRAQIAREYELNEDYKLACLEWRKVFGLSFPTYDQNLEVVNQLEWKYPSATEEFIQDLFPVRIDTAVTLTIEPRLKRKGFQDSIPFQDHFRTIGRFLPKSASVTFQPRCSLGGTANYYWKVRNLSQEAVDARKLRGEIERSNSGKGWKDSTAFKGTHYVECYAVKGGICVAISRLFVPIGEGE